MHLTDSEEGRSFEKPPTVESRVEMLPSKEYTEIIIINKSACRINLKRRRLQSLCLLLNYTWRKRNADDLDFVLCTWILVTFFLVPLVDGKLMCLILPSQPPTYPLLLDTIWFLISFINCVGNANISQTWRRVVSALDFGNGLCFHLFLFSKIFCWKVWRGYIETTILNKISHLMLFLRTFNNNT